MKVWTKELADNAVAHVDPKMWTKDGNVKNPYETILGPSLWSLMWVRTLARLTRTKHFACSLAAAFGGTVCAERQEAH